MRIDTRVHHEVVTIHPKERISVETEAQFTKVVLRLLDAGSRRLVLNLVDVPYIDSVGLGAIVQAYISARCRGGDLKLLHVRHRNRRLLTITKLLTVLEAYDTEDDVERSFYAGCEESFADPPSTI
jgi:anti-sigma B factor antagonist